MSRHSEFETDMSTDTVWDFFLLFKFPFSEPIDKLQARFHYSRYVLTNASEITFFLDNG